ncbi:hypothetical protein V6N12_051430 [Hibiscus sabdariffa]|uniref:DUF3741 domain-containing protein n=1 Tax=Hibiscus sabdariffa TaxID=183260 RepID=A0ABR2GG47_9ROSI
MGKEFHEQAVDVELESYHCHNDDPGCMGPFLTTTTARELTPPILARLGLGLTFPQVKSLKFMTMNSGKHDKMLDKEVSYCRVKEGLDVLEVLKVNKDLFLDILQDSRVSISQHVPGKQTSGVVKLTRSKSFPVSGLPCTRYLGFGTLEHK